MQMLPAPGGEGLLPWIAHGEAAATDVEFVLFGAGVLVAAVVTYRSGRARRWVPPLLALLGIVLIAGGVADASASPLP